MSIPNYQILNHMSDSAPNYNYMRPIYVSDDTPAISWMFLGFVAGLCVSFAVFCFAVAMRWI